MNVQLKATGYADKLVAELVRALAAAFGRITERGIVRLVREYAEPMVIVWPREPSGVLLLRVQEDAAPEASVPVDSCVPFVFRANGITVLEIPGLTLGTKYRFAFEVVG